MCVRVRVSDCGRLQGVIKDMSSSLYQAAEKPRVWPTDLG